MYDTFYKHKVNELCTDTNQELFLRLFFNFQIFLFAEKEILNKKKKVSSKYTAKKERLPTDKKV